MCTVAPIQIVSDAAGDDGRGQASAPVGGDGLEGDLWGDVEIELDDGGDADDEDDEEIMELPSSEQPSMLPRPNRTDDDGNPFITIIDVSGIHHLPVLFCSCTTAELHLDISYLRMGLFPTSFERIQTVFTLDVLKDFRLSNLECKTSAYQYYQKLRRLTCPAFPKAVLNRYRELRRLSREYRNIKMWKMFGRAHDEPEGDITGTNTNSLGQEERCEERMDLDEDRQPPARYEVPRGTLASFCPACPQPSINLPDDWEDDEQRYTNAAVTSENANCLS